MTKPVIIFAPGAWHPANSFATITPILTVNGYECDAVAFPSVYRGEAIKEPSLAQDIAAVREVVTPFVDAGREVVFVIHS